MVTKTTPIRVTTETSLTSLLDEAAKGPLLLERDGEFFRLAREDDIAYEPNPERVLKILDETVGGWADLDIDKIIADIYEARRVGSRPPDRP
ncbi:MAG: hypothetical protein ACRERD_08315 [Candidatus Binatia bacterium]